MKKPNLSNRATRARLMEIVVADYLDLPSKTNRDEFDQLVLDCAKAIRASRKKGKRK